MSINVNSPDFNPFPGLRPFTPEESDLFFGREGQSAEVVRRLLSRNFVTVTGASGSGKSSLIYCGVIPALIKTEPGKWSVISFRPGNDPLGNLAAELRNSGFLTDKPDVDAEDIFRSSETGNDALTEIIAGNNSGGHKTVIVVDQFEELFRYGMIGSSGKNRAVTATFVRLIVDATLNKENDIFFVLSMRSDFIGDCAHYQGLTDLINKSNYLVPHMTRENYRQVITGPVAYAGATIEEQLVEEFLNDVGDSTDQLPVLQHALMRTWLYWRESGGVGRPISITDYDGVGRMVNAMSRHADEAFEELSAEERAICEVMFKTITEKGSDNRGVRRPTDAQTICDIAGCTLDKLQQVVNSFNIPSRSFVTPAAGIDLVPETVIDVSHESLMRLWDRLRHWVDEEAASVQMYLRLSDASAMYQQGKAGLWRPPDLQLAINWREKNRPTLKWAERYNPAFERAMVYLATSEKEFLAEEENKIRMQKKQLRRSKITAMILGIAAIISLGFMLFAYVQKLDADTQRNEANENRERAEANRLEADKERRNAEREAERAMEEQKNAERAAEEARQAEEEARRQQRIATLNEEIAKRESAIAESNRLRANLQADSARMARDAAKIAEQEAVNEKERAQSLRMLAIGKSMSVKSLQLAGQDAGLQSVLAYQAYLFNKRHEGKPNDADIYAGLFNAVKEQGVDAYKEYSGHGNSEIRSIAFGQEGEVFFTSDQSGSIMKWILDGDTDKYEVVWSGNNSVEVLAVSPDSRWLASGDDQSTIRLIPLKGDDEAFELKGHTGRIRSLIFSYDGTTLYSASFDGNVLEWDMVARTSRSLNEDSGVRIRQIDVSSQGNFIAGLSEDGDVLVWDKKSSNEAFSIDVERNINSIRFDPASNTLAMGSEDGWIELWDVSKRQKENEIRAHNARVSDIAFNDRYNQIATSSYDRTIKIYDRNDLTEPPIVFTDNEDVVITIRFTPKGDALISGSGGGELISRPSHVNHMTEDLYLTITRNMTSEEWNIYVGSDIDYEATKPEIDHGIIIHRR